MRENIVKKEIKIVGVTFDNKDGECRQDIIEQLYLNYGTDLFFAETDLVEFEYKGDPAYAVTVDGKIVGNLSVEIAKKIKNLQKEQQYTFWLENGIIVGGFAEDDDADSAEKLNWGLRFTLCLASPEARANIVKKIDEEYGYSSSAISLPEDKIAQNNAVFNKINLDPSVSPKSRLVALLLCIFLGMLGVHRFYLGKTGTGLVWCFSVGCFYIGWIFDIIMIACGKMTDKDGRLVSNWNA